jgi:hypothetical protein
MKDSTPYRVYLGFRLINFPENSRLGIKKLSLQLYNFGSNRPKIKGKMHDDPNIFSLFLRLLLELFAEKLMSWSLGSWHSYIISPFAFSSELRATYLKKNVLFRLYLR